MCIRERERERERVIERESVCVCVCVCERERERERESKFLKARATLAGWHSAVSAPVAEEIRAVVASS